MPRHARNGAAIVSVLHVCCFMFVFSSERLCNCTGLVLSNMAAPQLSLLLLKLLIAKPVTVS